MDAPKCEPAETDHQSEPGASELSLDELAERIVARMVKDSRFRGPAGPEGKPGPAGPPGKDADTARLEEIETRLRALENGQFEVVVISPNGERKTGRVTAHGGQLMIDLSNL